MYSVRDRTRGHYVSFLHIMGFWRETQHRQGCNLLEFMAGDDALRRQLVGWHVWKLSVVGDASTIIINNIVISIVMFVFGHPPTHPIIMLPVLSTPNLTISATNKLIICVITITLSRRKGSGWGRGRGRTKIFMESFSIPFFLLIAFPRESLTLL